MAQSNWHVTIDGEIDSEAASKGDLLGDLNSTLAEVVSTGEWPEEWDVQKAEI